MDEIIETDVLIVGGGVTGLWAAVRAREFSERVTIVDKAQRDWGGQASKSGGAMVGILPGDSVQESLEDFVYYYDGLCNQELMEMILSNSYDRMKDLMSWGFEFIDDEHGRLKGVPQRALNHVKCYIGKPFGIGGKNMVGALVGEAERLQVQRFGRIMITDVLRHNDTIVGAIGFHTINGRFYIFKARAVILAVGNGGWKASYHHNTSAGDSVDIGLRAGARIGNCEFGRVWITPRRFAWEGQTYLLPLGAKLVNAKGESFMDKYSPVFGTNTDPMFVARGMAIEALKGNGPFYMDCSGISPENMEMVTPKGGDWMEINYLKLLDMGMDFFKDKLEWMPQFRISTGGIHADIDGATNVPGLFAAGRARTVDPVVYSGGLSLCLCAVTGHKAGETAGQFASSHKQLQLKETTVESLKRNLFVPLGKEGIPPVEVLKEVRETVFPYDVCILKNEKSLKKALAKIEKINAELVPRMSAKEPHYLMKLREVRGITLLSELFLKASLMRTESRAGHNREDYPNRDDKNWLCTIIASQKGNKITLDKEQLPIDKYKIKITRYYSDSFTFPNVKDLLPRGLPFH